MAVYVADDMGAIDKQVESIAVADAQGSIDKEVQTGYAAHTQGAITKQFYANWVLYSGTILNSSSGGGYVNSVVTLTPGKLSYDIKPVHIETAVQVRAGTGETETLRLEVEYLDANDNWVSIETETKTVGDAYSTLELDFNVSAEILTRQLRYRLIMLSGGSAEFLNFYGKCTQWWRKG